MKRSLLMLLSLFLAFSGVLAQEVHEFRQIAGKVVDGANNRPLHYASVGLTGTDVSNVTNSEGVFTLKMDARTADFDLVTIGHIGYATVTMKISDF